MSECPGSPSDQTLGPRDCSVLARTRPDSLGPYGQQIGNSPLVVGVSEEGHLPDDHGTSLGLGCGGGL